MIRLTNDDLAAINRRASEFKNAPQGTKQFNNLALLLGEDDVPALVREVSELKREIAELQEQIVSLEVALHKARGRECIP